MRGRPKELVSEAFAALIDVYACAGIQRRRFNIKKTTVQTFSELTYDMNPRECLGAGPSGLTRPPVGAPDPAPVREGLCRLHLKPAP